MDDSQSSTSLDSLRALHCRWILLIEKLNDKDLNRTFVYPETNKEISLKENMGFYAWHCDHHYAHTSN